MQTRRSAYNTIKRTTAKHENIKIPQKDMRKQNKRKF